MHSTLRRFPRKKLLSQTQGLKKIWIGVNCKMTRWLSSKTYPQMAVSLYLLNSKTNCQPFCMKENGWKLFVNILFFWKNCFIDIISQKMFNFKLIFFKWRYCHFGNLQTTGLSFRCISCFNSNDYELNGQEFVAPKPTPSLLLQPNQSLKSAHSPWVARKFSKCVSRAASLSLCYWYLQ